jgi:hypothetical protein
MLKLRKYFQDLAASILVNTTCRDIQTAILSRRAPIIIGYDSTLKLAFGEEYDKLYFKIKFIPIFCIFFFLLIISLF